MGEQKMRIDVLRRRLRRRQAVINLKCDVIAACCIVGAIYGASALCGIAFRLLGVE